MGRSFVQSIVPSGHDQAVYLVINNFGNLGAAFPETDVDKADLETVIGDLMSGQYSDSVRRQRDARTASAGLTGGLRVRASESVKSL
jgi:hypothetical protein